MKIKVIKTTLAAENQVGNSVKEYKEGEIYEIFDELAQVFLSENWGIVEAQKKTRKEAEEKAHKEAEEKAKQEAEEKALDETLENKAIQAAPKNKSFKENKKIDETSENI